MKTMNNDLEADYLVDKLAGNLHTYSIGIRQDGTPNPIGFDPIHGEYEEYNEDNPPQTRDETLEEYKVRQQ